jgi:primosomal replication protein N
MAKQDKTSFQSTTIIAQLYAEVGLHALCNTTHCVAQGVRGVSTCTVILQWNGWNRWEAGSSRSGWVNIRANMHDVLVVGAKPHKPRSCWRGVCVSTYLYFAVGVATFGILVWDKTLDGSSCQSHRLVG